ncbi:amidase [Sphingomonas lacunae]|uniref:Amidase n=1 Tax=Sphingomonas lacunae TaxID=2698828 RepID=A0A6M4AYJ1_9SPHN|nr:amidase [Sphingomonas lacunae]QJQ32081.1 amidase [Sphingomonas lacunae]
MIDLAALKAADAATRAFVDWDEEINDRAHVAGPLSGLTVGIKANIAVAGLPWTGGMGLYRGRIAKQDADVVARLRTAGATILGTLNMHEAALGATTDNPFYGQTQNPHRISYTPGGSSGGSGAAVAAGLCDIALGTDTLGSIRIPAAYCGVYGLKPTHGVLSQDGLICLEPSFDVIGPLAASLAMVEAGWQVLGGAADTDARPLTRLLLLDELGGVAVEPAVNHGYSRAIIALDVESQSVTLDDTPASIREAGLGSCIAWLSAELGEAARGDRISPALAGTLKRADRLPPRLDVIARAKAQLVDGLGDDGLLLLPTAPQTAFAHGQRPPANQADFTALASIAGLPAISLPAGWSDDGMPVGVQLIGPAGSEAALFAVARRLDAELNAYGRPPQFGINM